MKFLTALVALVPMAASALGPVVVRIGEAPMPPQVDSDPAAAAALGLHPPAPWRAVSVDGFAEARRALYEAADLATALEAARAAVGALPPPPQLRPTDRAEVIGGLWFTAHLLLNVEPPARDEAAAVLDLSLTIDPDLVPDPTQVSPQVIALRNERLAAHAGRQVTVRVPEHCRPLVDGRLVGETTTVHAGVVRVGAFCGHHRTPEVELHVTDAAVEVTLHRWQAALTLDEHGLVAPDAAIAGRAATELLHGGAPEVLTVGAESESDAGSVRARHYRRAQPVRTALLDPAEVAPWLAGKALAPPPTPAAVHRTIPPWHYALMGVGALMVAGGGLAHGLGVAAVEETSTGTVDHRPDFRTYEITYATLYSVGSATLVTGAILAILAATDASAPPGTPSVTLQPGGAVLMWGAPF